MNEADIVSMNKHVARTLVHQNKLEIIHTRKVKNEGHRQEVLHKKHERDSEILKHKQDALQRKEDLAAAALTKEKEGGGRFQALQSKWFIITAVATRITILKNMLQ
eukprot:jgi/Hompol1/5837/HPOL_004762-RA